MAYDKKKIFEQAKELVVTKNLIFIEDIIAYLPISKPTFYDYYKIDSNEFNELRKLLELNKIELKTVMRKKWFESDNATLQMGLMKLLCTNEEHKRLSQTYSENENVNKNTHITLLPPINDPLLNEDKEDNGTE